MADDAPTGVGTTALGVAGARAIESTRDDRLFDDPLAAAFLTAAGWEGPNAATIEAGRRSRLGAMAAWVVARTRFLDDLLLDAAANGVRQVVLLGAGLDSRAFRLAWPEGTRVFELDSPEMLAFKQRVVDEQGAEPRAERIAIAVDLREDWVRALRDAGFDEHSPTAWIVEGLLVYLDEDAVDRLLREITSLSAPGSRMGITASSKGSIDSWRETVGDEISKLWISALPTDPVTWLDGYGWSAGAYDSRDRLRAYGRPAPDRADGETPTWLIDARRR
jgi:methyltransferase (TIGR00027 family)